MNDDSSIGTAHRDVLDAAALHVLLVEDDPGDALMVQEALAGTDGDGDGEVHVHVAVDGTQALTFLRAEDAGAPRPALILLDLNLPGLDGREVLTQIKADEALRSIPVVVLTSSETDEDVIGSYGQHANAYISKPIDADQFAQAVRQVKTFFTTVAKLPR